MTHKRTWLIGGGAMAAVWSLALAGMALAGAFSATPEKVVTYIREHPLRDGQSPDERIRIVRGVADRVERLDFEQRRALRSEEHERRLRDFYETMTDAERSEYIDRTFPTGMKQLMASLNDMPRDERRQFVRDALADMQRHRADETPEEREQRLNDPNVQKIMDHGLKSFMTDADAATKIDLQPLIEQIQENLRGHR